MSQEEPPSPADTFNILLATDIHLGYAEKDIIRRNDSFETFKEILEHAERLKVDFLLLGGDLFHDNKPSRNSLNSCIQLLRKVCMNDSPVQFELLSDPETTFSHGGPFAHANYEDTNLNVGLPVFSIAGNHDDVTGNPSLCALDLLHSTGLVNFWGRYSTNVEKVDVSPLLLKKGQTNLALYGMSAIKDERLHHLFTEKKVKFFRPKQETDEDFFSMMVLHQNRAKHGETGYIPESFLPDFMSLVLWGHEHPCRIDPERAAGAEGEMYITQPGSSVATSLSEGEAGDKYIAQLQVHRNLFNIDNDDGVCSKLPFRLTKIRLETTRQFYFEHLVLAQSGIDPEGPDAAKGVIELCKERVEHLIKTAEDERRENQPDLPLIRLKVDFSGGYEVVSCMFPLCRFKLETLSLRISDPDLSRGNLPPRPAKVFNVQRFGAAFVGKVANPKDVVIFARTRTARPGDKVDLKTMDALMADDAVVESVRVEDLVRNYFEEADDQAQMRLLSEIGLSEAVHQYVGKEEGAALSLIVGHQRDRTRDYLKKKSDLKDVEIEEQLEQLKLRRAGQRTTDERRQAQTLLEEARDRRREQGIPDDEGENDLDIEEDDALDDSTFSAPSTSRGRGRGRGRGRAAAKTTPASSGRGRGSRGGRAKKGVVLRAANPVSSRNGTGAAGDLMDSFVSSTGRSSTGSKRRFVANDDDDDSDPGTSGPFASSRKKR